MVIAQPAWNQSRLRFTAAMLQRRGELAYHARLKAARA
jgi:hypothetical protein